MNSYQKALDDVGHHSTDAQGQRMTVAQIAERIGEPENRLRKELSAYDDAHPLNAKKVVALTLATRNHALVRHFCEATGGVFVSLPQVGAAHGDVMGQTAIVVKEFGDVLANAGHALADGRVTPEEAAQFRKHVARLIEAAVQFEQLMDAKAGVPVLRAVAK